MSNDFLVETKDTANPQTKVVHLSGDLDEMNIEILQKTVDPFLEDLGLKTLIFDFSGLRFINSKGIGYLVSVHTHLSKDARVLMIISASEAVMDVISLVGLTSIIPYFETLDEALMNA